MATGALERRRDAERLPPPWTSVGMSTSLGRHRSRGGDSRTKARDASHALRPRGSVIPSSDRTLDPALRAVLSQLGEDGWDMWARFDRDVRSRRWHSFVPSEYDRILVALVALWEPGLRFLEWGSATGIIAVMADLLGYEAYGIELDERLVDIAVDTAGRYRSGARFVVGSFLPEGYVWRPADGDGRLGTVGEGASGYLKLERPLDDFDLVYGYPWAGEEAMMLDLMRAHGRPGAGLVLQRPSGEVQLLRRGRVDRVWAPTRSSGVPLS